MYQYASKLPDSNGKVAVWGFCFGGTYAFIMAMQAPGLSLALPFYGHSGSRVEELAKIKCPVRAFFGENDERLMAAFPELKNE